MVEYLCLNGLRQVRKRKIATLRILITAYLDEGLMSSTTTLKSSACRVLAAEWEVTSLNPKQTNEKPSFFK